MQFIELAVSQGTLWGAQFGNPKGQPLILLHGNHQVASLFNFLEHSKIADLCSIYVPDLPGHGKSQGFLADDYRFDNLAQHLISACNVLFPDTHPLLIGHSLGGHIACQMVAYGFQPKRLGLVSTLPLRSVEDFGKAFLPSDALGYLFTQALSQDQQELVAEAFTKGIPHLKPKFLESIQLVDSQFRVGMARLFSEPCFQNEVRALEESQVPVFLALGEHDQFLNFQYYNEVLKTSSIHYQTDNIELVKDSYHFPYLSHPDWFVDFLVRCGE